MSAHDLVNAMKGHALALGSATPSRAGRVTSYDPNNYSVKVQLLPEETETGWLPLLSAWVGGGWGMFSPPSPGDIVEVEFLEDDIDTGYVTSRIFHDNCRPLPCPSGEFWLVHKSGSLLKFHNDGNVELVTAQDLNVTVGRDANVNVAGNVAATVGGNASVAISGSATLSAASWDITGNAVWKGNVIVKGMVTVDGFTSTGTLNGGMATFNGSINASVDVKASGISLKTHAHGGVQFGTSTTGAPQ